MGSNLGDKVEDESIEVSEKVAELMEMPEEERVEYCKNVIKAVAKGFEDIGELKTNIAKAKALKSYLAELNENMEEIRACVLYTIKKEFRDTYIDLLEQFAETSL